jgi:hypothetical protein
MGANTKVVAVTEVDVVEAVVDWVLRVVINTLLSLTDTLVCLLHAERRICLSRRTWFPYVHSIHVRSQPADTGTSARNQN